MSAQQRQLFNEQTTDAVAQPSRGLRTTGWAPWKYFMIHRPWPWSQIVSFHGGGESVAILDDDVSGLPHLSLLDPNDIVCVTYVVVPARKCTS